MKSYIFLFIALTIILSCTHKKPQGKSLQQLVAEDSLLKVDNAALELSLYTTDTISERFMRMYTLSWKPFYDCTLLYKIKGKNVLSEIDTLQRKIFEVADNVQLDPSTIYPLKDLHNPNENENVNDYFCVGNRKLNSYIPYRFQMKLEGFCSMMSSFRLDVMLHKVGNNGMIVQAQIDTIVNSIDTSAAQYTNGNQTWIQACFKDKTAAEDYVFLEELKNKMLKARLIPVKYWENDSIFSQRTEEIMERRKQQK